MKTISGLRRDEKFNMVILLAEQALQSWNLSLRLIAGEGPLNLDSVPESQRYVLEDLVYEATIAAWYTDYKPYGLALADTILLDKKASARTFRDLWSNIGFYVQRLETISAVDVDVDLPLIKADSTERYRPLNPSVVRDDDGYTILCKAVNFDQINGREYYVLDDDNLVRVRNFLIKTDKNLNRLHQHEVLETLDRVRVNDHGLEDIRLTRVAGDLWFTAFTRSFSESYNSLTVVGRLANSSVNDIINVEQMVLMQVYDSETMEKNWLPFAMDDQLYITYSVGPNMHILIPNTETGGNTTFSWYPSEFDLARFRGSAGPIEFTFKGVAGSLYVMHEVVYKNYDDDSGRTSRTYYHRFVFVDDEWKVTHLSRLFIFEVEAVEFCTGMVYSHTNGAIMLSVGIEDRKARLFEVLESTVAGMLVRPAVLYPLPSE